LKPTALRVRDRLKGLREKKSAIIRDLLQQSAASVFQNKRYRTLINADASNADGCRKIESIFLELTALRVRDLLKSLRGKKSAIIRDLL
ncbi:MAG: hypothetical protein ACLFQS_02475, partial [Bacteroidales bacterium]